MQSYRLERKGRGRGGRLSQSGLLSMVGGIKEEYADYSHSTVARWESGQILPTEERLETFGLALDLPRAGIHGLIALAGLGAESAAVETGTDWPQRTMERLQYRLAMLEVRKMTASRASRGHRTTERSLAIASRDSLCLHWSLQEPAVVYIS